MASKNLVILIGRVGKDPEVKHLTSGHAVCNLSLATTETWKEAGTGDKKEKTDWHRLVVYQKKAEIIGEYVKKGSLLYVEGKITYREWQDKEGQKRTSTEIVVDDFQFLDSKPKGGKQDNYVPPVTPQQNGPVVDDDQIPF